MKINPRESKAVEMSNIYYLFKAYDNNTDADGVAEFTKYLRFGEIPNIVQSVRMGNTPPFDDDDFALDGF